MGACETRVASATARRDRREARNLTQKQLAALDWLYSDGSAREWGGVMSVQVLGHPSINSLRSLEERGLARRIHRSGEFFAITNAGRAALQSQERT